MVAVQQQRVALRLQRQQHVAQRAPRAQRARAARQLGGHARDQRVHLRGSPARGIICRIPCRGIACMPSSVRRTAVGPHSQPKAARHSRRGGCSDSGATRGIPWSCVGREQARGGMGPGRMLTHARAAVHRRCGSSGPGAAHREHAPMAVLRAETEVRQPLLRAQQEQFPVSGAGCSGASADLGPPPTYTQQGEHMQRRRGDAHIISICTHSTTAPAQAVLHSATACRGNSATMFCKSALSHGGTLRSRSTLPVSWSQSPLPIPVYSSTSGDARSTPPSLLDGLP